MFYNLFFLLSLSFSCIKNFKLTPLTEVEQQEAEQLFTRHLMAIGGEEALLSHKSLLLNGTVEEMGSGKQNPFTIQKRAPNLYYIRVNLLEMGIFERGYDGINFWERTPQEARMLSEEEVLSLSASLDLYADINWKKWYPKIIYRQKADFAGEIVDAITVENHLGTREKLIFSEQTGLKIGHVKYLGQANETLIRYGQYIQKDNVKIPLYIEEKQGSLHKLWLIDEAVWDRSKIDFRPPPILMEKR